jgi:5-oxoprolinase (ATP-hydrolysing) subunit A
VRYVKPHGALYNTAADDPAQAGAVAAAVAAFDPALPLLGLPDSALHDAASAAGLPYLGEAFADRAYRPDGRLVSRTEPGAVIADTSTVVAQAVSIARDHRVRTTDGSTFAVTAASLCVHGDTPGAVALARAVRAALAEQGISVEAFAV